MIFRTILKPPESEVYLKVSLSRHQVPYISILDIIVVIRLIVLVDCTDGEKAGCKDKVTAFETLCGLSHTAAHVVVSGPFLLTVILIDGYSEGDELLAVLTRTDFCIRYQVSDKIDPLIHC